MGDEGAVEGAEVEVVDGILKGGRLSPSRRTLSRRKGTVMRLTEELVVVEYTTLTGKLYTLLIADKVYPFEIQESANGRDDTHASRVSHSRSLCGVTQLKPLSTLSVSENSIRVSARYSTNEGQHETIVCTWLLDVTVSLQAPVQPAGQKPGE